VTPSLDGPRAKLDRANDHIASLDIEIRAFFDGDDYTIGSHFDRETEQHVITARIRKQPPLTGWALIAGDALHNLRSSLDHLIYQLAIAGTCKDPPPDEGWLEFPIFIDEHGDKGYDSKAPRKIQGVPAPAETVIEGVQPFSDPAAPLWVLQTLDIIDKHRRLNLGVTAVREITAYDDNSVGIASAGIGFGYLNPSSGERLIPPLEDGVELGRCRFGDAETNRAADVKIDAPFDVLFDERAPEVVRHKIVTETLVALSKRTDEVIRTLGRYVV
jgi:hypothetical protein